MRTGISFLIKAASLSSVILLCLHVAGLAEAPPFRHFKIDYGRSAKYLPYDYDSLLIFNYGSDRIPPVNIAQVLSASVDTTECVFVEILNPMFSEDRPPDINIRMIPGKRYEGFTSSVTVTDLRVLLDSSCQCKAIVETGFRNDSAFAVKQQVLSDGTRLGGHLTAFLATGKDKTGDGKWQATTRIINAMDYDYDGRTEVFLHVDPLRDLEPFLLVCLELETFRIEWTLPVSPTMLNGFLLSCNDQFNPGVMFVTNAPGFGVAGEFDGRFSYLVRVDKNGKRIFRRIIGKANESVSLISSESDTLYYLACEFPLLDADTVSDSLQSNTRIYKISRNGFVVDSAEIGTGDVINSMWMSDYDGDGSNELLSISSLGVVRIFDKRLRLLAQSDKTNLWNFVASLPAWGEERNVWVLNGDAGTEIYSQDFRKIAALGHLYFYVAPLGYDVKGNLDYFLTSGQQKAIAGKIVRRGFFDHMLIVYLDYRNYILALISALAGGILVINYYRSRTKGILQLTRAQKAEIENASKVISAKNAELEKAYADLQLATDVIARQRVQEAISEQHRVASGQFRHEINNALGAVKIYAESLLRESQSSDHKLRFKGNYSKLSRAIIFLMEKTPELDTEMRTNILQTLEQLSNLDKEIMDGLETLILKGVNRGLSLADKLRKYERIDQDETQTQVNLAMLLKDVVEERQHRLDAADAKIVISVPSSISLIGSPELFAILLGNLLDNSIDALLDQAQNPRRILVSVFVIGQTGLRIVWEDTGMGIKPESISKIFQPFYTEKPRTGSGLGLSMVKNIVEKYRGTIDVESVVGQYTRLTIDFPDD